MRKLKATNVIPSSEVNREKNVSDETPSFVMDVNEHYNLLNEFFLPFMSRLERLLRDITGLPKGKCKIRDEKLN